MPDRLAHGDPAAALHAVHDEAAAALAEQEPLVAERRPAQATGGRRSALASAAAACCDGVRRRARAPARCGAAKRTSCRPPNRAAAIITPSGGAQEARGIALEQELPPQLVGVLDMPVAEEAEPRRAEQHGQRSRSAKGPRSAAPAAGSCGRRPGATAAAPPARPRDRAPPPSRRPLTSENSDAGRQHERTAAHQAPSQAPAQAQRQHEEGETGEAAEEMRELDQRQRRQRRQPVEPLGHGRRGAGDEQDGAADEDQHGQQVRQHELRAAAREVDPAGNRARRRPAPGAAANISAATSSGSR